MQYPLGQRGRKLALIEIKRIVARQVLMLRGHLVVNVKRAADGHTPVGYGLTEFDHLVMNSLRDMCVRYNPSESALVTPLFTHTITYQLIQAVSLMPHPVTSRPAYPKKMGPEVARRYLTEVLVPRILAFDVAQDTKVSLEDYMLWS
jgi:hypothetical protein